MAFHLSGLLRWMDLSFASQGIGPDLEQMAEKMDDHRDLLVKLVRFFSILINFWLIIIHLHLSDPI